MNALKNTVHLPIFAWEQSFSSWDRDCYSGSGIRIVNSGGIRKSVTLGLRSFENPTPNPTPNPNSVNRQPPARKSSWFYCQTKKRLVKQTIALVFRHLQRSKHNRTWIQFDSNLIYLTLIRFFMSAPFQFYCLFLAKESVIQVSKNIWSWWTDNF